MYNLLVVEDLVKTLSNLVDVLRHVIGVPSIVSTSLVFLEKQAGRYD